MSASSIHSGDLHGQAGRLARTCRTIVRLEWLLLAAVFPVVLFLSPWRSLALLLLPLLWAVRKAGRGQFVPPTPLDWLMAGFLLLSLLNLFITVNRAVSLPKIVGLAYGVAVYYAAVAFAGRSRRTLHWGIAALLGAGLGVALLGLTSTRLTAKAEILRPLSETLSVTFWTFPGDDDGFSANRISGALLWTVPLSWVLAWHAMRNTGLRGKRWLGSAVGMALLALALTGVLLLMQSRAALVAASLTVAALLLFAIRRRRRLLLAVVLALGFLTVASAGFDDPFGLGARISGFADASAGSPSPAESLSFREEVWARAIEGVRDFALTGMGMDTFREVMPRLYPTFAVRNTEDITHAHNQILLMGVDLGLPGIVLYVALLLGLAIMLRKVWLLSGQAEERALALGLGSSLLAFEIYGLFDSVGLGEKPSVVFWLLIGLVAALHKLSMDGPQPAGRNGTQ